MALLHVLGFITHPYATKSPRPDAGPRVTYAEPVETVLTIGFWVMGAITVLCVVLALVGHVLEGPVSAPNVSSCAPSSPIPGPRALVR